MENKNGGNDNIDAKTLKTLVEHLVDPLTHIYNICIDKAIWPGVLKSAEVIAIHKSKVKYIATNYRPIYYALFHSIISYGIIVWGGAYSNIKNKLNRLHIKLLKIINKNKFSVDNPMSIDQIFTYESLSYH